MDTVRLERQAQLRIIVCLSFFPLLVTTRLTRAGIGMAGVDTGLVKNKIEIFEHFLGYSDLLSKMGVKFTAVRIDNGA